jgi:hypothetical protein
MDILNTEFLSFLRCAQQNNLRYLLIGGYAVNYYGYVRNTDDMDIWLAPNNENKKAFIDTLLCMHYSAEEITPLHDKDFTTYFMGSIGTEEAKIDVITIVHYAISYDEAEMQKQVFEIEPGVLLNVVPYSILKDMKLRSSREKDLFDIARLEEIINKLKK